MTRFPVNEIHFYRSILYNFLLKYEFWSSDRQTIRRKVMSMGPWCKMHKEKWEGHKGKEKRHLWEQKLHTIFSHIGNASGWVNKSQSMIINAFIYLSLKRYQCGWKCQTLKNGNIQSHDPLTCLMHCMTEEIKQNK